MSPSERPAIAEVDAALARLDAAIGRTRAIKRVLGLGAKRTQVSWLGQQLGVSVPLSLGRLLCWHNGERNEAGIFHALVIAKAVPR